jgi:hypothetical protein
MIYKINGSDAYKSAEDNADFIIFSFDGSYALVRSNTTLDYAIESYSEDNLSSLLSDPLYTQPCKDCQ